jgi:glycosyltransferase involved in cell wall biosynthesis
MQISILNAGQQTDYLYGLVSGLSQFSSLKIEVVDSDNSIGLFDQFKCVKFFNLRGNNLSPQSLLTKICRISWYYVRLLWYAISTKSKIFHIQWENSLLLFDRTLLNLYYKLLGKKLVFTAHNVYKEARDNRDNIFYWLSLKCMYHIVDRIIVHTPKMKKDLCSIFHISPKKIVVVPHGINIRIPNTEMNRNEARKKLSVDAKAKVILFFGLLDEYKGIETLIDAVAQMIKEDTSIFLMIVGNPKRRSGYVPALRSRLAQCIPTKNVLLELKFIPVDLVETYFTAADCLVLPYKRIFQSGVLFLAYRFGIPVIATDVGNFRDDVIAGVTGFICKPNDSDDMVKKIKAFFKSDLFRKRKQTRIHIIKYAELRYSWADIGKRTFEIYSSLLTNS